MTDIQSEELTFTDLVQFVRSRTGLGYAKAAKIVDKAIEPHIQADRQNLLQQLKSQLTDLISSDYTIGRNNSKIRLDLSDREPFLVKAIPVSVIDNILNNLESENKES